jgi:signal transduction histidine kinase
VLGAREPRESWWPAYRASRDEALVTSTVACAAFIPPIVVALTALMVWLEPATLPLRVWLGAAYVVLCMAAGVAWYSGFARRHAVGYAIGYVVVLTCIAVLYWHLLPVTADGAISTLLVIQMGTALLFPWGPVREALVCLWIIVGYAWLVHGAPAIFQPYSAGLMVAITPLMVLAAFLIERYRSAAFLREWQKDQIVSLTREIVAQSDPREVSNAALMYGMRLVGADSGLVALRIPSRAIYRIESTVPPESDWMGLELADDFGLMACVRNDVLALPEDDPDNPVLLMLAQEGKRHALYVAVREGTEPVGLIAFARAADVPFDDADRALARAVADQAGLALRTARVIHDLQRANQLKSEFVSTMSHELRTPLNVILGYAEMARDGSVDVAGREDCVRRIEASGHDLLELIESTLEIGKLEAARADVRREPVPLRAFWRQLGEACERLPRRPGVALHLMDTPPDVTLDTDPRKLTIIVRNLVGNACKFTERGQVRVDVACERGALVLRVSDTGIGISPKDRDAIFEMFRQADGSDARRYGGVGLGLYIVRRFVEQLGGRIDLDSMPGVGTTFTVSLPAPDAGPVLSAVA